MTGRPINQDRLTAIELGFTTYTGMVHRRCGTSERYLKGGGCVHCGRAIATEQRQARIYLKKMEEQKVAHRDDDPLDTAPAIGLDKKDEDFDQSIEEMM